MYEFRVWPAEEEPVFRFLRRNFRLQSQRRRVDYYFLTPGEDTSLVPKVRGGKRFEIKRFTASAEGVSISKRIMSERFPIRLGQAELNSLPLKAGGILKDDLQSADTLRKRLRGTANVWRVEKSRLKFVKGRVTAEITDVTVCGRQAVSIAFEARTREPLMRCLTDADILHLQNRDYGNWLRQLPLPSSDSTTATTAPG